MLLRLTFLYPSPAAIPRVCVVARLLGKRFMAREEDCDYVVIMLGSRKMFAVILVFFVLSTRAMQLAGMVGMSADACRIGLSFQTITSKNFKKKPKPEGLGIGRGETGGFASSFTFCLPNIRKKQK